MHFDYCMCVLYVCNVLVDCMRLLFVVYCMCSVVIACVVVYGCAFICMRVLLMVIKTVWVHHCVYCRSLVFMVVLIVNSCVCCLLFLVGCV